MGKVFLVLLAVLFSFCLLYLLFLAISALLVDTGREYDKDSSFYRKLLYSVTDLSVWLLRIQVHISGKEKLPEGRFLLVGNHRSNFDPILTWYVLKEYQLAFISKEENFHVPLFGRIIRRCCFMAIDRENPRNAMKTILKAAELLKQDEVSVAVYPEGTRSKSCKLLPFHNGVFKIAQKAEVPIVVVAVRGTETVHKKYIRHRSDVWIDIIDVLSAEEIKGSRSKDIGDRVYGDFQDWLAGQECR